MDEKIKEEILELFRKIDFFPYFAARLKELREREEIESHFQPIDSLEKACNEWNDLSAFPNNTGRYKEYEKLKNMKGTMNKARETQEQLDREDEQHLLLLEKLKQLIPVENQIVAMAIIDQILGNIRSQCEKTACDGYSESAEIIADLREQLDSRKKKI